MHPLRPKPPPSPKRLTNTPALPLNVTQNVSKPLPRFEPFVVSSKLVFPPTALPNSITAETIRRTKHCSTGLAKYTPPWCEQQLSFSLLERLPLTGRSKQGMVLHRTLRQQEDDEQRLAQRMRRGEETRINNQPETTMYKEGQKLDQWHRKASRSRDSFTAEWTCPEEHAAHMFILLSNAMDMLQKYSYKHEFSLFGFEFDRAFHGSVDKLELLIDPKTLLPGTISLHEVKTTYKESLSQRKNETAIFQTSLYMAFLRRMLDKNTPFDFDPYFRSRGLDPHRAFNPTFASAFSKLQHKFFNPLGSPPRNLQQVVEQWKSYLQSLPTFNIDNRVWVTTIREGRISPVGGFGRAVVSSTASYESREVDALEVAKSVVDLLDGRRQPRGVALGMDNLCIQCPYNHKCPWRPDLHIPHRDVRPLVNPIRDYSVEIPVEKTQLPATLRQPANTGVVGNAILSEGSSGVPSGNPQPKREVKPSHKEGNSPLMEALERIKASHGRMQIIKPPSAISLEIRRVRNEQKPMSAIKRLKLAKQNLAEKYAEKRRVAYERKKIAAVERAAQTRALRDMLNRHRKAIAKDPKRTQFTGIVPYVAPTIASSDVTLFKPSLSRIRMKRREAEKSAKSAQVSIPQSGQAIPEDETYSAAKLRHVPKPSQDWTYQFDSLPSLAELQTAMIKSEADTLSASSVKQSEVMTDAEMEENEREERRAQRRRKRESRTL